MSSSRRPSASSSSKTTKRLAHDVQAENETLRQELFALRKILATPINESNRSIAFRYQIFTLEKQIALLTRLLDAKREAVATCETILLELHQFLQDLKDRIHRKEQVDEMLIQTWLDRIESNRKKSFKCMQDHASLSDHDTLYAPNSVSFVRQEPIHLLDICSGKIEHLNLKHIAILETSLSKLHADLRSFQNELLNQTNHFIFPNMNANLIEHSNELSNQLNTTTNELFHLSLLVPTRHQKCSFAPDRITTDNIWQRLNDHHRFSPNIKLLLQSIFDSLICAFNHQIIGLQLEVDLKNRQLSFYRHQLTSIHCKYIQNLFEILSNGQQLFNRQLQTRLYEPLSNLMREFDRMSSEKTDATLKSFLFTCKIHADQFNEILRDLSEQITNGTKGVDQLFIEMNEHMWKEIKKEQQSMMETIAAMKKKQIVNTTATDQSIDDFERILETI